MATQIIINNSTCRVLQLLLVAFLKLPALLVLTALQVLDLFFGLLREQLSVLQASESEKDT